MVTKKIFLKSSDEVFRLFGQQDENLHRLENIYSVQIFVRQSRQSGDFSLVVRGPSGKVDRAVGELEALREAGVERPQNSLPAHSDASSASLGSTVYVTHQGKHIRARSKHQKEYVEFANKYDLVIAIGPAGTGKTFLAVASALKALQTGIVSRIVLTRPVVEAGEKLGFLPGDLHEKINPYLKPLYDAFNYILGPERFRYFREDETIEIIPLAYMRGRTLDDAYIILDEAQNATTDQMKMFLTRLGMNSRMVVTGDVTQIDLEKKNQSGLVIIEKILSKIDGIKTIHFNETDVVRHSLVKKIIQAYETHKA